MRTEERVFIKTREHENMRFGWALPNTRCLRYLEEVRSPNRTTQAAYLNGILLHAPNTFAQFCFSLISICPPLHNPLLVQKLI